MATTEEHLQDEADSALAEYAFASAADLYHRVLGMRESQSARAGLERARKMLRKELDILHMAQSKAQAVLTATAAVADDGDDGRNASLLWRGASSPQRSYSGSPRRATSRSSAAAPPPSPMVRLESPGRTASPPGTPLNMQ